MENIFPELSQHPNKEGDSLHLHWDDQRGGGRTAGKNMKLFWMWEMFRTTPRFLI